MQCKIIWIHKKPEKVEQIMNEWLAQNPNIQIKHVTMQPNFCFAIFYE